MEAYFKNSARKFESRQSGLDSRNDYFSTIQDYGKKKEMKIPEVVDMVTPTHHISIIDPNYRKLKKKFDPDDVEPDDIIKTIIDEKPSMTITRKLLKRLVKHRHDPDEVS
jgi:hypothetical protein